MRSPALTFAAALLLAGSLSLQAQGTGGAQGAAEAGAGQAGAQGQAGQTEGGEGVRAGIQGEAVPRTGERTDSSVFTGCLMRATDALGARGEAAGTQYVLTQASPGSAGGEDHTLGTSTGIGGTGSSPTAPATGSTADTTASGAGAAGRATAPDAAGAMAGTAGQMTRHAEVIGLQADDDADLSRYVGQRVEVHGRLAAGAQMTASERVRDAASGETDTTAGTAGGEIMSPRPSAGDETGATGTAGTTGDTRDRAQTTTTPPTAGIDAASGDAGRIAAFEVESVRVVGGMCETDEP